MCLLHVRLLTQLLGNQLPVVPGWLLDEVCNVQQLPRSLSTTLHDRAFPTAWPKVDSDSDAHSCIYAWAADKPLHKLCDRGHHHMHAHVQYVNYALFWSVLMFLSSMSLYTNIRLDSRAQKTSSFDPNTKPCLVLLGLGCRAELKLSSLRALASRLAGLGFNFPKERIVPLK